jgi:hypothetical protein
MPSHSAPADRVSEEGCILHATASARAPVTVAPTASQQAPGAPTANAEHAHDDEWSGGDELLIRLNDTGGVHGNDPENAWLLTEHVRVFEAVAPYPAVRFQLVPSEHVGGRSWKMQPKIPQLLELLGMPRSVVSKKDPLTLRRTS